MRKKRVPRDTQVPQADVPTLCQVDVTWLQVSMKYNRIMGMHVLDRTKPFKIYGQ